MHRQFKLVPATLYLTVNIVDRYLSISSEQGLGVFRTKLQLVGAAALLLAWKYEETHEPEVSDMVHVCDRAYPRYHVVEMEEKILVALGYELTVPTAHAFLVRYLKAGKADVTIVRLACYLLDGTLVDYDLLAFRPSQLAAAAVLIARRTVGRRAWSPTLEKYAEYEEGEVLPVARAVLVARESMSTELRAVKQKYGSSRYGCVADMEIPSCL